jgi:hypothetical protein
MLTPFLNYITETTAPRREPLAILRAFVPAVHTLRLNALVRAWPA